MRTIAVLIIPALFLITACDKPDVEEAEVEPMVDLSNCQAYPQTKCRALRRGDSVKIDLDNRTVTPECVLVRRGNRPINFSIESSGTIERHGVRIRPKEDSDKEWLKGSNSRYLREIRLSSPESQTGGVDPTASEEESAEGEKARDRGKVYKYYVWTPEWCLDPRVHVE